MLAPVLAACGGGGGGGGGGVGPAALAIVATALAAGDVRYDYDQTLVATGGSGSCTWSLVPATGTPPPGIDLSGNGRLSGRPTANGTFAFQVRAVDSVDPNASAARLFSIAVGALRVDRTTPHWGDVWVGDACALTTPLETSAVSFALRTNATGATLLPAAPLPPTAAYVAGPVPGRDVVRCTAANGRFVDVPVDVMPDCFANHVARFGDTDVWYVDFEAKLGATAYPTDFDAALATMGLRGAAASAPATTADRLARAAAIRDTLKWLNLLYLNTADGTPSEDGLAISFPHEPPGPPYSSPPDAQSAPGAPSVYNVIALHGKTDWSGWGVAIGDPQGNANVENITPTTAGLPLGIYLVPFAPGLNALYGNVALPALPVGAGDEPTLRAMLYGLPPPSGARADEVRRVVERVGCAFGALIAHEIGHAIGFLTHSSDPDSVMAATGWAVPPSPTAMPAWSADEIAILRVALPGPGR